MLKARIATSRAWQTSCKQATKQSLYAQWSTRNALIMELWPQKLTLKKSIEGKDPEATLTAPSGGVTQTLFVLKESKHRTNTIPNDIEA